MLSISEVANILRLPAYVQAFITILAYTVFLSAYASAAPGSAGFQGFKDSNGLAPALYAELPLGEHLSTELSYIWERPLHLSRLTLRYGGEIGLSGIAVLADNTPGYGAGIWLHSTVAEVYTFRFDYGYYLVGGNTMAIGEAAVRVSGRVNEFGEYGLRYYNMPGKSVTRYFLGLGIYF